MSIVTLIMRARGIAHALKKDERPLYETVDHPLRATWLNQVNQEKPSGQVLQDTSAQTLAGQPNRSPS